MWERPIYRLNVAQLSEKHSQIGLPLYRLCRARFPRLVRFLYIQPRRCLRSDLSSFWESQCHPFRQEVWRDWVLQYLQLLIEHHRLLVWATEGSAQLQKLEERSMSVKFQGTAMILFKKKSLLSSHLSKATLKIITFSNEALLSKILSNLIWYLLTLLVPRQVKFQQSQIEELWKSSVVCRLNSLLSTVLTAVIKRFKP